MLVDNLWRRRKRPESQLPEKRFGCHFGRAEAEPVAGSRDQVSNKDGVQVTTGIGGQGRNKQYKKQCFGSILF